MWRPDFRPDPALFPFESRFFESGAGRVHYVDEGEGPPMLFLHGNPTWSFLYRDVIRELREHFRCVAPDYPGFGLSDRPDAYGYTPKEHARVVLELVRALDLDDLTVVGHDWGGPIGMWLALEERERLRALVMGNTWYWPVDDWTMQAFSRILSTRLFQHLILRWNFFVRPLMSIATAEEIPNPVLDHYRGVMPHGEARAGVAVLPRELRRSAFWLEELAHAVPRRLGGLPLLLIWGMKDFAFRPSFRRRFREDFEVVREVELDGAAHYLMEDAPQRFAAAIIDFFGIESPVLALRQAAMEESYASPPLPSAEPTHSSTARTRSRGLRGFVR